MERAKIKFHVSGMSEGGRVDENELKRVLASF